MERWRDNGPAYGLGLAVLSIPITVAFLVGVPPRLSFHWMTAFTTASGAFGMFAAGVLAYSLTSRSGSLAERVGLMTAIVMGAAFAIAAMPFLAVYIIGWFLAWWLSITNIGVPILALTVAWSLLYLAVFGPPADSRRPRGLFATNKTLFIVALLFSLLGLAATAIALWKLPSAQPF